MNDTAATVRPNLFLVGAAKAGTTSLHAWLSKLPEVWMSTVKEPGYFAADETGVRTPWARDVDAYLSLFAGGRACPVRGESTPAYLLSRHAAGRIATFAPDARVVMVLRNPVDAVPAVFAEARKYGTEPERSFARAWRASATPRSRIERQPGGLWLRYRSVLSYPQQIARYEDAIGPDRMLVIRFEDLVADTVATCDRLLSFLAVSARPSDPLPRENEHYAVRSRRIAQLMTRPPEHARGAVRATLLTRAQRSDALRRFNHRPERRQPLSPSLRAELVEHFRADVRWLEQRYGWDLSSWLEYRD